jgi:hypothetical protein
MICAASLSRASLAGLIMHGREAGKHLALDLIGIFQIVHMRQHEAGNRVAGRFDGPWKRMGAFLSLKLKPNGIEYFLQPVECFRAARTRADLHHNLFRRE